MRSRIAVFVAIIQTVLFLAHWFLYRTWIFFWAAPDPSRVSGLEITLALLSVSFVLASLMAWRSSHFLVRILYTIFRGLAWNFEFLLPRGMLVLASLWRRPSAWA